MQTQQIVRGSAEVLTITRLAVNDVYKRVEGSAYSNEPVLRYGVVTDVMDNGPDAAVVAVEFRPAEYGSGVQIMTKVITGNSPLAIFPARPEEVTDHMAGIIEAASRAAQVAREAWEKAEAQLKQVQEAAARLSAGELTAPATSATPLPAVSNDDPATD